MSSRVAWLALGCALAASVRLAAEEPRGPEFEVASIKPAGPENPGRTSFDTSNGSVRILATVKAMIGEAYGVPMYQIQGGPSWLDNDRWEIAAKIEGSDEGKSREDRTRDWGLRLRALLADRFALKLKLEKRDAPVYFLVQDKKGVRTDAVKIASEDRGISTNTTRSTGSMVARGGRFEAVAKVFGNSLRRTVIDKTGLDGIYDFTLTWTPEGAAVDAAETAGPSIFTALPEQLGLRLESGRAPVDAYVVERAERPTEN